jgi:hypothetical protein
MSPRGAALTRITRADRSSDWLPDGSMLITTRFGATDQL